MAEDSLFTFETTPFSSSVWKHFNSTNWRWGVYAFRGAGTKTVVDTELLLSGPRAHEGDPVRPVCWAGVIKGSIQADHLDSGYQLQGGVSMPGEGTENPMPQGRYEITALEEGTVHACILPRETLRGGMYYDMLGVALNPSTGHLFPGASSKRYILVLDGEITVRGTKYSAFAEIEVLDGHDVAIATNTGAVIVLATQTNIAAPSPA